jgi:hypothetical protein
LTDPAFRAESEPPFPGLEEWLDLPCPEVSEGFVEATWQRVRQSLRGEDDAALDPEAIELPRPWLAAFAVPEPSPGFVESTLRAVRAPSWQRTLAGHAVPEPSPDFVDRVLRSLRDSREGDRAAAGARRLAPRKAALLAAAAALVLAALLPLLAPPVRDPSLPFEVLASRAFTPDPWGAALSSLSDRGLAVATDDPRLRLGELAGLVAVEARR